MALSTKERIESLKQRQLRDEIEEISSIIGIKFWDIKKFGSKQQLSRLKDVKDKLIRGQVITSYTMLDEFLSHIIANKLFDTGDTPAKQQKFELFFHYISDSMYLLQKLKLVDAITKVPKEIRKTITTTNDLRNALAHSYFPELRREYKGQKKVLYRGVDIFTPAGIQAFKKDVDAANDYFLNLLPE